MALVRERTTPGVVRIGDTVRRPPGPGAGFIRSLLRHLESVGFDGAPRYLGVDECGRETLSYIPGHVPPELGNYSDAILQSAASLIRRYHDATSPLFGTAASGKAGVEVACHNDLSPCNTVFRDGQPYAFIDFDAAGPGSRAYDLGYAAWLWLDVGGESYTSCEQTRRLRLFVSAYGSELADAAIVQAMLDRQSIAIAEAARTGKVGMADWAKSSKRWTLRHWLSEA